MRKIAASTACLPTQSYSHGQATRPTDLGEALERPLVTLEGIAQLKHDSEQLEELPIPPSPGHRGLAVWQTIRVYTRQSAQVNGRALYAELTRRLREAGAAGVTTVRGLWGYSSDEPPHGDKFARLTSHAPPTRPT